MGKIDPKCYIEIPYRNRGRDRSGVDCYGLVLLVFKECFNVTLMDPWYESAENVVANEYLIDLGKPMIDTREIDTDAELPKEGDLILMRYGGFAGHIGIYLEGAYVLHTRSPIGTVCERLFAPSVAPRVRGVYRVR